MKKPLLPLLCLFLLSFVLDAFGQTKTNIQTLNRLSVQFHAEFERNRAEVIEFARIHNLPIRYENEKGSLVEMQFMDPLSGMPQYYITNNVNSAATISTNLVHPGGNAGLNLDGTGMTIHEWDGGIALTTHQEFDTRVTFDDGEPIHWHSTHVAGTMIASGFDAGAKGMAPAASLRSFRWTDDDSEMATEAAAGALVSNHSYGQIRGWYVSGGIHYWFGDPTISSTEDYQFGFYDASAQDWDDIAYNAPSYLIVKSAGNDRGESWSGSHYYWNGIAWTLSTDPRDADGGTLGYDCIGNDGVSKNILTVGAVNDIVGGYIDPSDVVMSTFSGWGPADDGRIKPDICTNGVGLYSATSDADDAYTTSSGTSMAAPSATGSLALLQQHYNDLNGTFMQAATLKALVIHTADEAGFTDGPDYIFGWGLMNTTKAIK